MVSSLCDPPSPLKHPGYAPVWPGYGTGNTALLNSILQTVQRGAPHLKLSGLILHDPLSTDPKHKERPILHCIDVV